MSRPVLWVLVDEHGTPDTRFVGRSPQHAWYEARLHCNVYGDLADDVQALRRRGWRARRFVMSSASMSLAPTSVTHQELEQLKHDVVAVACVLGSGPAWERRLADASSALGAAHVRVLAERDAALARAEAAEAALRPFAAMHREGSDPREVAITRGVASDMTWLTSGDFACAAAVLHAREEPSNA